MLELEGVSLSYADKPVLNDISLVLPQGERLAVLGPSGCGKSSLLNIIAGLVMPDSGVLRHQGRSLVGIPPEQRHFALMFQDFALFPHLSVLDNVTFGLVVRGMSTSQARKEGLAMLASLGLATYADNRVWNLSGGEQQRVALARALVTRPALILLDEPFSSLDANLREGLQRECVERFAAMGTSMIMVTHDRREALQMADRIAVMQSGRIVQVASAAELVARPSSAWLARFLGWANVNEHRAIPDRAFILGGDYPPASIVAIDYDVDMITLTLKAREGELYRVRVSQREWLVLGELKESPVGLPLGIDGDQVIYFA